jgi:hypothetical protein
MFKGLASEFCMNEGSTYVGLGERMSQRMAPTCDWTDMGAEDHFVQFFESDDFIVDQVAEYMIHGLRSGDACIVVATREHLAEIEKTIAGFFGNFESALREGRYIALDAHETLSRILTNGTPDADKFNNVIGGIVLKAADAGGIRIFGEMVGVLCSNGRYDEAVRLEGLWNDLRRSHKFSLFCGYSMEHLSHPDATKRMGQIFLSHSCVMPTETYSTITGTNERLKHIAALQQRTKQLEAELAELEMKISARQSTSDLSELRPLAV